jgi:hypothetical protein
MKIDMNTPIDELLELWATFSYKLFHKQSTTWEDLEIIKTISKVLDERGIIRLEIFNKEEKRYTLRYYNNGSEFIKEIQIDE